jgi:hypothetical protein
MRIEKITPGIYAAPANAVPGFGGRPSSRSRYGANAIGTASDVSDGYLAAPVRVVAVGNFRWKQSGVCAQEIVEDHYVRTVRIVMPDVAATFGVEPWQVVHQKDPKVPTGEKRIGFRDGLKFGSGKIQWTEDIVQANRIIMPWGEFLKRHDEWLFVQAEMKAYQERLEILKHQMQAIVIPGYPGSRDIRMKALRAGGTWTTSSFDEMTHIEVMTSQTFPVDKIPGLAEIIVEAAAIEKKMSCAR